MIEKKSDHQNMVPVCRSSAIDQSSELLSSNHNQLWPKNMQSTSLSLCSSNLKFQPKWRPFSTPSSIKTKLYSSNQLSLTAKLSLNSWSTNPQLTTSFPRKDDIGPLRCGLSSNSLDPDNSRSFRDWVELIGEAISTAFPIWVSLGCLLGLMKPSSFNWVQPKMTIIGLTLTMLGMGMTLTLDDLRGAFAMPKEIISGFVLQYSVWLYLLSIICCHLLYVHTRVGKFEEIELIWLQIMPISGFLVSKLLNLPSHYAAGLILVGCCPGGKYIVNICM